MDKQIIEATKQYIQEIFKGNSDGLIEGAAPCGACRDFRCKYGI
ncbi:hypothetical protein [Treponema ruminis]|uniref:Cytidine deaminase n=1 Tax=Treponema ruminis TaxID=744515 RepID=A0A7W8LMU7_9SPIR|nr:hypothetical protein [Treponema ruminis]MBB5226683.1 cytidine deaminase [Treponema ruminis]